jgi:alkylated DNA repair dioxygenase AlkB
MQVAKPSPTDLPEGFAYQQEFLTVGDEQYLLRIFEKLDFKPFDFKGYIARRRIVEYGFEYDFGSRRATVTTAIPDFLRPVREKAATWAGIRPDEIVEAVITEYAAGAPIGWHRDVPQFELIIGISLNSSCRLRFKPYKQEGKITSVTLQPRSAYVLQRAARWKYQHSIPAVQALRYSVTFRTLRRNRSSSTAPEQEASSEMVSGRNARGGAHE